MYQACLFNDFYCVKWLTEPQVGIHRRLAEPWATLSTNLWSLSGADRFIASAKK